MCLFFINRLHKRAGVSEVGQDGIVVAFCYRDFRNGLVYKLEDVAAAFLAEIADLIHIHDILSVAAKDFTAFEAVFNCLQAAAELILLELALAVCVPDFDVVIVGLDIIQIVHINGHLECTAVVI